MRILTPKSLLDTHVDVNAVKQERLKAQKDKKKAKAPKAAGEAFISTLFAP